MNTLNLYYVTSIYLPFVELNISILDMCTFKTYNERYALLNKIKRVIKNEQLTEFYFAYISGLELIKHLRRCTAMNENGIYIL